MIDPRQLSFEVEYEIELVQPRLYFPTPPKKFKCKVIGVYIVGDRGDCNIDISSAYGGYSFYYDEIENIKKVKKKKDK